MPLRRTIRPWLIPWLFALFAVVVGQATIGLMIRDSVSAAFDASQRVRELRSLVFESVKGQLDEETGFRGYVTSRDLEFLQPYVAAKLVLMANLATLKRDLIRLNFSSAVVATSDAQRVNEAWRRLVAEPAIVRHGRVTLQRQKLGKTLVDRFRLDLFVVDNALAQRNDDLQRRVTQNLLLLTVLTVFTALALFGVGAVFALMTANAWRKLAKSQEQQEESRIRAVAMKSAYDAEKRVAETLQKAFIQRRLPALPFLAIDAVYVPAREEELVGGDWYDVIEIDADRVLVMIGDVAGHGVDAAVAMSRTRDELFAAAVAGLDPAGILRRVNDALINLRSGMVTALMGIIEAESGEFRYAIAGHPPPLVVRPGDVPARLSVGELPLGIIPDVAYATRVTKLEPGTSLILYTDGAIEQSRDVIAGERRLVEAIVATANRVDLARAIYEAVFSDSSPRDDVAIVTLRFIGKPERTVDPGPALAYKGVGR